MKFVQTQVMSKQSLNKSISRILLLRVMYIHSLQSWMNGKRRTLLKKQRDIICLYRAVQPPSMDMQAPWNDCASSLQRCRTKAPISSGRTNFLLGWSASSTSLITFSCNMCQRGLHLCFHLSYLPCITTHHYIGKTSSTMGEGHSFCTCSFVIPEMKQLST